MDGIPLNTESPLVPRVARSRRGITLTEVLVVIGLLALLMAILLPAISYARLIARDVVCTSRLRDLALASMAYKVDYGMYPSPCRYQPIGDDLVLSVPQNVNTRLINNLGQYLKFARVYPDDPVTALPHHVQAPWAERITNGRGPKKALLILPELDDFYYTGYIYTADLDLAVSGSRLVSIAGNAAVPRPQRFASSRREDRGVLWADDLHHQTASGYWSFGHGNGGEGSEPFTYLDLGSLRGQHRAMSDGSVEWISGAELRQRIEQAESGEGAAYQAEGTRWWF